MPSTGYSRWEPALPAVGRPRRDRRKQAAARRRARKSR